jgi:hypothetical protein
MANQHRYGFHYVGTISGGDCPEPITLPISSAYAPNTGAAGASGTEVNLNIGDPVQIANYSAPSTAESGTVWLAQPGQGTSALLLEDQVFGIVAGFPRVKIAGACRPNAFYTNGTTYTGDIASAEATLVKVIPVANCVFEIDVLTAGGASFNTAAEYMALVSKQAHFLYTPLTSGGGQPKANPGLDLSTVTATLGRQLTVLGVSRLGDAQDYESAFVRLRVKFNTVQLETNKVSDQED